ncbi:hypothetical protein METBIDRAFT_30636 [Metschnikowia bicuspidata var. bicuspidata NRRL YB-4993]|uniref:Uncharacterized protein n=1 Tax=Metschnikowia bicuspidata var. bicuspidata NRRL YB-4993 TaxID=869754 RepID=A0A1A0HJJ8_9ASCO|nr:hypothetical protein METBIDRAFT_30636 [Metschnikowia bicuspidata var. bicuspidata NRRL YB-4993]OBA24339.1 hypothetical protein METBIDRAFT_30636 [Metschnikowia bicuspidata var. bicuspidata NRRL YB-4993]
MYFGLGVGLARCAWPCDPPLGSTLLIHTKAITHKKAISLRTTAKIRKNGKTLRKLCLHQEDISLAVSQSKSKICAYQPVPRP